MLGDKKIVLDGMRYVWNNSFGFYQTLSLEAASDSQIHWIMDILALHNNIVGKVLYWNQSMIFSIAS